MDKGVPMDTATILCVADDVSTDSLLPTLRNAGYELLVAGNAAQATALLFIHRRIEAVVLDQRTKERTGLGLARVMRSLRADVPILLLSRETLNPLPRCLDACICVGQELSSLLPILNTFVHGTRNLSLELCGGDKVRPGIRP